MFTRRIAACALAAAAAAALADEPARAPALTAAQVVARNAVARGGLEAWRKIHTMAWAGRVESAKWGGHGVPFELAQQRPDRSRFELTVEGQKAVRVFDGAHGWKTRPSSGGPPEVRPYTADELAFARSAPVIEGPLMDHAARGAAISLAGVQEVDGRKAYVLGLRLASGSSFRVWIDAETFLELRYDRDFVDAEGRPAVASVRFADYRAVEGLQVPFTIQAAGDRLVIERVALNPRLDDRAFAEPVAARVRRSGATVDTRSAATAGRARPGG